MVRRTRSLNNSPPETDGAYGLFRIAAETSHAFVILASDTAGISFINPVLLKALSLRSRDLVGRPLQSLIRRADGKPFGIPLLRNDRSGTVRLRNFAIATGNGSHLPCRGKVYVFGEGDERKSVLVVGCRTDAGRTGEAHNSRDISSIQSLSEAIPDGFCVLDEKGTIVEVNSMLPSMLGVERKNVLGRSLPYPWHSLEEGAGVLDALREAQKRGPVLNRHVRGTGAGDLPVVLSYSIAAMDGTLATGRVLFVVTIRDVTGEYAVQESGMYEKRIDRLKEQMRRNAIRLRTLQDINTSVLRSGSLPEIFKRITRGIGKLVDHDLAGIYVFDDDEKILRPHTLSKQTTFSRKLGKFPLRFGQGIIGTAAISGDTVLVNDAQHDPRSQYPPGMKPPIEHIIAAPLRGRDSTYGILVVARNREPRFHEEDALVVKSFADAANVAIENARLYQELGKRDPGREDAGSRGGSNGSRGGRSTGEIPPAPARSEGVREGSPGDGPGESMA